MSEKKDTYLIPVSMICYGNIVVRASSSAEAIALWRAGKGTLRVMEGSSRNKSHWQLNGAPVKADGL